MALEATSRHAGGGRRQVTREDRDVIRENGLDVNYDATFCPIPPPNPLHIS